MQGANLRGAILAEVELASLDLQGAEISRNTSSLPFYIQVMLRDHALWQEHRGVRWGGAPSWRVRTSPKAISPASS